MTLKQFKQNKFFKFFTNKYIVIFIAFSVWMFFFDENSYLLHNEYNKEIKELETGLKFYQTKIIEDKKTIKSLEDTLELERFAREKYLMKKENEDLYIIEFDSIKK